jgi:tripartite-type tricarboxylate transporter receptor subunit TctC
MRVLLSLLSIASLMTMAMHVRAQSYPNQAINLVIPLAPGDATDVAGRTMGEELSKLLRSLSSP